jgi:hypothetical protein
VAFWAWRLAPENDPAEALIIGSVYFAFAMSRDIRARGQTNIYAIGPIVADCAVGIEGEDAGLVVSLPEEADLRTRTSHFQASEEFRVTRLPAGRGQRNAVSLIGRRKSRPFLFQLLTDGLHTLHALLKSLGLIPLSNTRIC